MLITENETCTVMVQKPFLSVCLSSPTPNPFFLFLFNVKKRGDKEVEGGCGFFFFPFFLFNDQPRVVFSFPEVFLREIYLF